MSDPHPHAQLIRDFHDRQNRFYAGGDQEPVRVMLTPEVAWHVPGHSAIAGEHRGRDEVLRYFAERRTLTNATFRIDVRGVLADDQRTVIIATGVLEHDGEIFTWGTIAIFRVAEGKIAECWVVPHDQGAYDEIWSTATIHEQTKRPGRWSKHRNAVSSSGAAPQKGPPGCT